MFRNLAILSSLWWQNQLTSLFYSNAIQSSMMIDWEQCKSLPNPIPKSVCNAPIRCTWGARKNTSESVWSTWRMCTAETLSSLLLNCRVFVSVGSAGKLSQQDLDLQHYWGHSNFIWNCGCLIALKIGLQEMLFKVWGISVCWKKTWRNYAVCV